MDNRERLIEAAVEKFRRQGYAHTSVEDLLTETGIARSNFYYHFDNKLDLARHVVSQWASAYRRAVADGWEDGASADERRRLLFKLLRGADGARMLRRPITALAVELAPHDARIRDDLLEVARDLEERFGALVADGRDRGRAGRGPGDAVPHAAMSALLGSVVLGNALGEAVPSRGTERGLETLLSELKAARAGADDAGAAEGGTAVDGGERAEARTSSTPPVHTGA